MSIRVMTMVLILAGSEVSLGAGARVYEVVDMGSFAGGTVATRISETGYATGFAWPGDLSGYRRAFSWSTSGGMVDLGRFQGLYTSIGTAIDDNGRVAAMSFPAGTVPILSDGAGGWTDLSAVAPNGEGWRLGAPVGIDAASGRITFERGYTWTPGESLAEELGVSSRGGGFNVANSAAMAGEMIVGSGYTDTGEHAYMWTPNHGVVDVHAGLGGDHSVATAVSQNGYGAFITERDIGGGGPQPTRGDFEIPPGGGSGPSIRGVLAKVDPLTGAVSDRINLGSVGELTGVNDFGHATGKRSSARGNVPTLFRDGRRYDANSLLAAGSGWSITELSDINSCGQIVGTGYSPEGDQRAVMLRLAAPPMQVQDDNRTNVWTNDAYLGDSSTSFGDAGCFVTSTSMLLNTFGHSVTPGDLNAFLTPHMTTQGILSYGEVPSVANYGQEMGEGVPVNFRSHNFTGATREALVAEVKRLTAEHGPIVLRVPYYSATTNTFDYANGTHAIVAYRVENGEILVRNPGSYHSGLDETEIDTLTLDQYIAYENGRRPGATQPIDADLSWLRDRWATYAEASGEDDAIQGTMHSPVEFVITDPQGRRLGFDPTANGGTGEMYNEIPDSFYGRIDAVRSPDGTLIDTEAYLPVDFYVADLLDGDYTFTLFALDEGEWTLNFGISDIEGFDPQQFVFQGDASDLVGGASYSITYEVPAPATGSLAGLALLALRRRRRS